MTISTSVLLPPVHPFVGMDLASALADRARRFAERPFLIWEPVLGGQAGQWTYGELAAEVDRVAAGLVERGVRRGDAVMLLLDNSPAFLFCWFACARLGAVAVDVNTRYSPDELSYAFDRTGAVGVITHEHLAERVNAAGRPIGWMVTIDDRTGECPALRGSMALPEHFADPAAPMCLQFTSGTTSRPKAVLYTHANVLWAARVGASHGRHSGDDVLLVYAPLFHTMALSWQTLAAFWVGATVVLQPKFSASRFWEISTRHGCTHTSLLGIMMQVLTEQPIPQHCYKHWNFGLEMPPVEQRYGVRLFNAWGMTEVVTRVIINNVDVPEEPGAIGRPATEYSVRVVREDGSDAAIGEPGDLLVGGIRGVSLFAEYLGDPVATAESFDERGYFKTGDRVRVLPSGAIQFVTRAKDMLKVGGENVAAAEIERVVAAVPGVAAAAVVARKDRMLDEVAVVFVVAKGASDPQGLAAAVVATCREQLADFKVPRAVHFIDELPESLLGKINKGELRELAAKLAANEDG